jgi:hypothetical protein
MKPKRPAVVLVFAILQLSFGGLGFLCMGCGGAMQLSGIQKQFQQFPQPGGRPNLGLEMEEFLQRKKTFITKLKRSCSRWSVSSRRCS